MTDISEPIRKKRKDLGDLIKYLRFAKGLSKSGFSLLSKEQTKNLGSSPKYITEVLLRKIENDIDYEPDIVELSIIGATFQITAEYLCIAADYLPNPTPRGER